MASLADQYFSTSNRIHEALLNAVTSGQPLEAVAVSAINVGFDVEAAPGEDGKLLLARGTFKELERLALEDGLRRLVVHLCTRAAAAGVPVMKYDGKQSPATPGDGMSNGGTASTSSSSCSGNAGALEVVLDLVLRLGDRLAVDSTGAAQRIFDTLVWCHLLEDIMDMGTVEDCHAVFHYIDTRATQSIRQGVRQGILRLCNQLVKRLSKQARDVALCGSVLLFMARLYPLSDKSGVNLPALSNTAINLPLDQVEPGALDSGGVPINDKLYATFWGLQRFFQDPARVLTQGAWAKASSDITTVLKEFDAIAITVSATGTGSSTVGAQAVSDHNHEAGGEEEQQQAVSYLSSSKLFGLQLRDATFRRYFLVQCLILCGAVQQPGKGEKDRAPSMVRPPTDSVAALVGKIYEELRRTPESGPEFAEAVRHVLLRDDSWVAWKMAGCPPFDERPPAPSNDEIAAATAAVSTSERFEPPVKRRRVVAAPHTRQLPGSVPYTKPPRPRGLVAPPQDNMAGLTAPERRKPLLKDYLKPFIDDLINVEPGDTDGEREKVKHTAKVYEWRAKRMLSRAVLETYASCKEDIEIAIANYYPDVKAIIDKRAADAAAATAATAATAAAMSPADAVKAEASAATEPTGPMEGVEEPNGHLKDEQ